MCHADGVLGQGNLISVSPPRLPLLRRLCSAADEGAPTRALQPQRAEEAAVFSAFVLPPIPSSSLRMEFLGSPMPSSADVLGTLPSPEPMDAGDEGSFATLYMETAMVTDSWCLSL